MITILCTFLIMTLLGAACPTMAKAPLSFAAGIGLQGRPRAGVCVAGEIAQPVAKRLALDAIVSTMWLRDAQMIKRGRWDTYHGMDYESDAAASSGGVTLYSRRSGWVDFAGGAQLRLAVLRQEVARCAPVEIGFGADYHYMLSVEGLSPTYVVPMLWDTASQIRSAVSARVNFLPSCTTAPLAELEWQHGLNHASTALLPANSLLLRLGWRFHV